MAAPSTLLITPIRPAGSGNGLAMRAGLLLEGLRQAGPVDLLVVPVAGLGPDDGFATARATRIDVLAPTFAGLGAIVTGRARRAGLVVVMRDYLLGLLGRLLATDDRPPVIVDLDEIGPNGVGDVEGRLLARADLVLLTSPADRDRLAAECGLRVVQTLPNAVVVPDLPAPPPGLGGHDLLLVGNLSYEPNVAGAHWLVDCVLPRLRGARLAIVGSAPTPALRSLAGPRVTLAADVPDITPWYRSARVAVVPVSRGGGSRIKLIEAFAHGRPVVATPAGAAGLPWGQPDPVCRAQSAEAFAAACAALLADGERAGALADAGRELVLAHASHATVAAELGAIADKLRNAGAAPAVGGLR
jgi:glycosyltransferase involved in cell wall biosynthesis